MHVPMLMHPTRTPSYARWCWLRKLCYMTVPMASLSRILPTFFLALAACTATQDLGNSAQNASDGTAGAKPGPLLSVKQVRQTATGGVAESPLMVSVMLQTLPSSGILAIAPSFFSVRFASGRVLKALSEVPVQSAFWVDGRQLDASGEGVVGGATMGPLVFGFGADAYQDAPVALGFEGPNGETSSAPLALEPGNTCTAKVTWTDLSCTREESFTFVGTTYPDRDGTFCGGCENLDASYMVNIVGQRVGTPLGVRVHPTDNYALGNFNVIPLAYSRCLNGARKCTKSTEVVCPAVVRIADTRCGGFRESYKNVAEECTDLSLDPQHCGRCDNLCAKGQTCQQGTCQ